MKKFLIGLVAGLALAFLFLLGLVLAAGFVQEPRPRVARGSTLVLDLEGEAPERPPMTFPIPRLAAEAPATMQEIWTLLDRARADDRIEALVLRPRGLDAGWGKLQQIRESILAFKSSGKPVFAYLRSPGAREYYLAATADKIFLAREDLLNVKGLRIEAMYLGGTLDKIGVQAEIEHAGKYKDAGDMYSRRSMSPETREVLDSVLDLLYAEYVEAVAESRNLPVNEVKAALDEGPFLAQQALALRLVDDLIFEDEMYSRVAQHLSQDEVTKILHGKYLKATEGAGAGAARVAYLVGSGTILRGAGGGGFGDDGALYAASFIKLVREIKEDDRVAGVILRIDSPGGDAIASDEILHEIQQLRAAKPLVISMSDVAASGGYYIAMTGDPVIAYEGTITGSIGVIYGKFNLKGLYDKLGVQKEILTRGRFADIDSDYTPLTDASRRKLQEGVHAVYDRFLTVVSEGRDRSREEVEAVAEGRAWLGSQARDNGLIDEIGGLDRALELLRERAGLGPDEPVNLVAYPKRRSLLEYLMERSNEQVLAARLRKLFGGVDVELLGAGGYLRLLPYSLEIK